MTLTVSAGAPSGGIVTIEFGKVTIAHAGVPERSARRRDRVASGDVLTVERGAKATVLLSTPNDLWSIGPLARVKVGPRKLVSVSGPKPVLAAHLGRAQRSSSTTKLLSLGASIRGDGNGLSPSGILRRGPVVLHWPAKAWQSSGTVLITSLGSGKRWISEPVNLSKGEFEVPQKVYLDGGWKTASVGLRKGSSAKTIETQFRVLNPSEERRLEVAELAIQHSLGDDHRLIGLSLAELYAEYGLTSEFESAIGKAFGEWRSNGEACFRLAGLYRDAELKDEALACYYRARDLGFEDPELPESIRALGGR